MPSTQPTAPSRHRRPRRLAAGLILVVVALGASGCSAPAPGREELSDALVDSGLSRKVADCTAKALTESLTEHELAEINERGSGGAPVDDPKVEGESADKLAKAMTTCRELQIASQPTTTTTTTVPGPFGETGGSTTSVAPNPDGAELNPASTTTTAAP